MNLSDSFQESTKKQRNKITSQIPNDYYNLLEWFDK